jgi:hypothetical protein
MILINEIGPTYYGISDSIERNPIFSKGKFEVNLNFHTTTFEASGL